MTVARFTDRTTAADFRKMPDQYQDLVVRLLSIQADCEIGGPHLYVDAMLPSAPTPIDQLVVARTAAEEIDHFRKFARLAGDIGVDTAYLLSRSNQERYLEAFRGRIRVAATAWTSTSSSRGRCASSFPRGTATAGCDGCASTPTQRSVTSSRRPVCP